MKQDGKFILMNREELVVYFKNLKNVKKFTSIQQHNTGDPDYKDFKNNHIEMMKSMEKYHISNKGMSEIAQHFSTFPDGLICVGRPLTKDGGGFLFPGNKDSITLEHFGNFDYDIMTEEQKKSIILLNALLCNTCKIVPSTISMPYHCWVKSTQCPGAKFFGGSTKASAEKNFIPLIKAEITNQTKPVLTEYQKDIKVVTEAVDTPYDFWVKKEKIDTSFPALVKKFAAYVIKTNARIAELEKNIKN